MVLNARGILVNEIRLVDLNGVGIQSSQNGSWKFYSIIVIYDATIMERCWIITWSWLTYLRI